QVDWGNGLTELLWTEPGFESGGKRPSGSGIPILFPHPGRIAGGKYEFEGTQYSMPLTEGHPNSLHGFVLNRPWEVEQVTPSSMTASFRASKVDPKILDYWPSDFLLRAEYSLSGNKLLCDLEWHNKGDRALPYGVGTHTYFRLPLTAGSSPEEVVLTAPIDRQWELVDMLGTGKQRPLEPGDTFATGLKLAGRKFDDMFHLSDAASTVVTSLTDRQSGRQIVQRFPREEFPNLVIYTPGHREAICLEPYSCAADPFRLHNTGIDAGLRVRAPGETGSARIELTAEQI